jgi:hypothetical protein
MNVTRFEFTRFIFSSSHHRSRLLDARTSTTPPSLTFAAIPSSYGSTRPVSSFFSHSGPGDGNGRKEPSRVLRCRCYCRLPRHSLVFQRRCPCIYGLSRRRRVRR